MKEALKYKSDGNDLFKKGNYFESVILYSKGLQICPLTYSNDRSILYANRAASKHKLVSYFFFFFKGRKNMILNKVMIIFSQ